MDTTRREFISKVGTMGVACSVAPLATFTSFEAHAIWPWIVRALISRGATRVASRAVTRTAARNGSKKAAGAAAVGGSSYSSSSYASRGVSRTVSRNRSYSKNEAMSILRSYEQLSDVLNMFDFIHGSVIADIQEHNVDAIWINNSSVNSHSTMASTQKTIYTDNIIEIVCRNNFRERFYGNLEVTAIDVDSYQKQVLFKTPVAIQERKMNKFTGTIRRFDSNGVKRIQGNVDGLAKAVRFQDIKVLVTDERFVKFA